MRRWVSIAWIGSALVLGTGALGWALPATLVVDDDGLAAVGDCDATTSAFPTIQAAVDAAGPGDTILVCPGVYDEQVTIRKAGLTVEGSGIDSTIVKPTGLPNTATSLFSEAPLAYIILVDTASGVTLKDLTVDGTAAASRFSGCEPGFIGVFYRAATGSITNVKVTGIQLPPDLLGCQNQLAIFVQSGYGPHLKSDVTISGNTIEAYGKNGITCNEAGTRCIIAGNTVRGLGPTHVIGQNGIQLGFGAHGRVLGNTVSGHNYTPEPVTACGILIFRAGGTVSGNEFQDNESNVCNSAGVEVPEHPFRPVQP